MRRHFLLQVPMISSSADYPILTIGPKWKIFPNATFTGSLRVIRAANWTIECEGINSLRDSFYGYFTPLQNQKMTGKDFYRLTRLSFRCGDVYVYIYKQSTVNNSRLTFRIFKKWCVILCLMMRITECLNSTYWSVQWLWPIRREVDFGLWFWFMLSNCKFILADLSQYKPRPVMGLEFPKKPDLRLSSIKIRFVVRIETCTWFVQTIKQSKPVGQSRSRNGTDRRSNLSSRNSRRSSFTSEFRS